MLDYIFQKVSKAYFYIGAKNIRSQVAIKRVGSDKIAEEVVVSSDGTSRLDFVYVILKDKWK